MAIITKQRKTFTVINYVTNESSKKVQTRDIFYNYEDALERKNDLESRATNEEIKVALDSLVIPYISKFCRLRGSRIWSSTKYESMSRLTSTYLKSIFGKKRIKDISCENAQRFIYKLQKCKAIGGKFKEHNCQIPYSVLKLCVTLLRQSFDYLVITKVIDCNPFHDIEITVKNAKKKPSPVWEMKDVVNLFDNCKNEKLFIFLHLYFSLQLDITEVLALTWDNVVIDESNGIFEITSDKILRRQNKVFLQDLDQELILEKFPNYASVDSNTSLVLLRREKNHKELKIPLKIATLISEWKKVQSKRLTSNPYNLVMTLDNARPYDFDNMRKEFKKLKHECMLDDYSLVKLKHFAEKVNEDGIKNVTHYYENTIQLLEIPNARSNSVYRYHQARAYMEHVDIRNLLPDEKEVQKVKTFIELIKSDETIKQQILSKLKAGK
ncbi:MAG: hypothetical protein RR537_08450 [Longicatena sp.]|uniref:hypothetical protein n=1 Tax=Anaerorhabdus sp. TaxID=1872524 RepID=UPI002FCBC68F